MTTTISPPSSTAHTSRTSRRRTRASRPSPGRGGAPCCSLQARPQPQAVPAPTWEELLGQR